MAAISSSKQGGASVIRRVPFGIDLFHLSIYIYISDRHRDRDRAVYIQDEKHSYRTVNHSFNHTRMSMIQ